MLVPDLIWDGQVPDMFTTCCLLNILGYHFVCVQYPLVDYHRLHVKSLHTHFETLEKMTIACFLQGNQRQQEV
jgi:hypothetical protein